MKIKNVYENAKEWCGGIALILGISLIISIGVKWLLTIVLIPLLLLFTFLGIDITFDSDVLSTRMSIIAYLVTVGFLIFADKFIKKK